MNKTELLQLRIILLLTWVAMLSVIAGLEIGRYFFTGKFGDDLLVQTIIFVLTPAACLPFLSGYYDETILKLLKREPVKK